MRLISAASRIALLGFLLFSKALSAQPSGESSIPQTNNNAIQTIYRLGVPHTDSQGQVRMDYEAGRSFFSIGIWGAQLPGRQWESESDWGVLSEAGFNTVWPWYCSLEQALDAAEPHGLQIVYMGEVKEAEDCLIKDHPRLLGNVWHDEPIGKLGSADMDALFADFNAYRARIHALAPGLPVFINDAPWIMPPATEWWLKWNASAELACHDNYPIMNRKRRAQSIGAEPNGIPQSVSLGVANGHEQRPQWLIVGAFEQPGEFGQAYPFRFPTPQQLRASVYAGIIHGATGIIYFTWDTYVPRDGGVIGMAPNPKAAYTPSPQREGYTRPSPATPMQLIQSRALWEAATQINRELAELTPVILSPSAGPEFVVDLAVEGEAVVVNPIRVLVKPLAEGGYLLLTVNLDDAVLRGTYRFPNAVAGATALYENQLPLELATDAREVAFTYEPYAVHLIQITFAPSSGAAKANPDLSI